MQILFFAFASTRRDRESLAWPCYVLPLPHPSGFAVQFLGAICLVWKRHRKGLFPGPDSLYDPLLHTRAGGSHRSKAVPADGGAEHSDWCGAPGVSKIPPVVPKKQRITVSKFLSTLQLTTLLSKSFRLRLHCYTLITTNHIYIYFGFESSQLARQVQQERTQGGAVIR